MILLIFNSLFCQYHKFKQSKKHRFTNSKKLINANDLVIFFEANGLGFFVIHVPAFPPSCVPEVSGTQAFRPIRARKQTLNLL